MTGDSAYWMNRIVETAQELTKAEAARPTDRTWQDWLRINSAKNSYAFAVKKYTNPFNVEKGTTA